MIEEAAPKHEPQAAPVIPAENAAPTPQGGGLDDLNDILAEYDRSVVPTEKPSEKTEADLALAKKELIESPGAAVEHDERTRAEVVRNAEHKFLLNWAQQQDARQKVETDQRDFDNLTKELNEIIGEDAKFLPKDYAASWLRAKLMTDGSFFHTLENRYGGEDNLRRANNLMKHAQKEFLDHVKKIPNRELTEDRMTVAAAVRGTNRTAPASPPPNYGKLNDREFADKVESDFGFRPGI